MSENRDQYNHGGMLAFVFSMAFVLVFFVYIVVVHPGIDLGENLQTPDAVTSPAATAAVDVSGITEPWVANADMVAHGQKLYTANCAMCHGPQGRGDGAAGQALNPKPRDLVAGQWKQGGGYINWYKTLTTGVPGTSMAPYAHMKPLDRWALVQFIDSITTAKNQDDPAKVAEFAKSAQ